MTIRILGLVFTAVFMGCGSQQNEAIPFSALPKVERVDTQPLVKHIQRLAKQLEFLGNPLEDKTLRELDEAFKMEDDSLMVAAIQNILDPYCLLGVHINPESRVKTLPGPAAPHLYKGGSRRFLVKIHNQAGVTSQLNMSYTGAGQEIYSNEHGNHAQMPEEEVLFNAKLYMPALTWYHSPGRYPLNGLELNYAALDVYCGEEGKRETTFAFQVGQGTQDLGFRAELPVLFKVKPSYPLILEAVKDEDGKSVMANFVVRGNDRRVYPPQSQRIPPDFWFHPQVYRTTGQEINLPRGSYTIYYGRGPEYLVQSKQIEIKDAPLTESFTLKRWIDPSLLGYWSGDHHIHAAGCAHYTDPTEGVLPQDMMNHILGEDLKVGSVLTWGPGFDYQKQFFTGETHSQSQYPYTMRYDVEVSGFGSHQSGHLVLLRLQNQIYPGGESKDHWPTLGLNTLKWAQKQGAVCGPAHSGYGINVYSKELPNYQVPPYNSIGANEYIVDVTHEVEGPDGGLVPAVDFISTGDTWPVAELNMWYHTLNCGFRTRISGETDFPCITGARVGIWRSYVRLEDKLDYDSWCEGISQGSNYVSDGFSHLLDFKVGGVRHGEGRSTVELNRPGKVKVELKAGALLDVDPTHFRNLFITTEAPWDNVPWDIANVEREGNEKVKVEIIVNGQPKHSTSISTGGEIQDLEFDLDIERSSWVAARIFPSSHTNPVWIEVNGDPVRASRKSAQWCLEGVEKCWQEKQRFYDEDEMEDAIAAYEHARTTYTRIIEESQDF